MYSYDDFDGDLCLNDFTVSIAPDYVFEVLNDIKSVNSSGFYRLTYVPQSYPTNGALVLRVHLLPWSPVRLFHLAGSLSI